MDYKKILEDQVEKLQKMQDEYIRANIPEIVLDTSAAIRQSIDQLRWISLDSNKHVLEEVEACEESEQRKPQMESDIGDLDHLFNGENTYPSTDDLSENLNHK